MDTIEKTVAQPEVSAAAAAAAERVRAASSRVDAGRRLSAGRGPAAAPRSAISTTTATSTSSSSNVGQNAVVLRNDGGNRKNWLRHPNRGHEVESRRHRLPREGRVRVRPDSVLHRQHRGRLSLGQRQAADRRARRRRGREAGRDPLAVRHRADDSRTCKAGQTLDGDRAGAMMTRRELLALAGAARAAASGVRPGRLVARRQAAASRQAVRPSVPRALHRCREAGRPDRAGRSTAASTRRTTSSKSSAAASRSSTTTTTAGSICSC